MNTFKHFLTTALIATTATAFAQTPSLATTDSTAAAPKPKKSSGYVINDFSVYVGVNNLSMGFDLRPIGSRFVALAWQKQIPLATTGATKLRLITGPEIAWNNFMFEGNNRLVERANQLVVEPANAELHRSKLVTTQFNLPLIVNVAFRSGLTLGVGAYAGVRLDSYTKVKPVGESTVRNHSSYNLNPLRWGLTTELGFRHNGTMFFRYEPNSPFRPGQGPDASVWAVGFKL